MRHGRSAVALASLLSLFGLGPPASAQRAPRGRVRLSLPGLPPPSPAPATPPAPAPPPAPTGAIPPGYEYFEVIDLTTTFRDDDFLSVTVDPKDANIAYVGTFQGRVYRTSDRGRTWNEAILIPELKEIWGFAGQPILFGHIRNDLAFKEDYLDLAPHMTQPPAAAPNLASRPNYQHPPGQADPLAFQSTLSSGNAAEVLGVGLSLRAPRLSLFVSSRGRPVPRLSFQKLLQDRGVRGTWILRIFVNPGDTKILFASTLFGLYKSYDRGVSWVRTFAGSTLEERTILGIGFDPEDPMHVLLGTSAGVYGSSDGGENWTKVTTIPDVSANEIIFDVTDPRFIYIGAGGGVFRSDDGGKNFVPIYYSTLPPAPM